jgi:hypothetical protein
MARIISVAVILTKVRIFLLVLKQILNQVQDDGPCHSGESQNLRFLTITQIPDPA